MSRSIEPQLDALHYATLDMSAYTTSPHKYIVLITDYDYHEYEGGSMVTISQVRWSGVSEGVFKNSNWHVA